MSAFSEAALAADGFVGFVKFCDLDLNDVPTVEGIYVVLRDTDEPPVFLRTNPGGWFKGRDPTEDIAVLRHRWVEGARVVYIGKASKTKSTSLRRRIGAYRRFGQGKRVGHWGGRYIWQCADLADYAICWKDVTGLAARDVEREMLARFKADCGKLPFANINE